jgi:ferrous iron transport protein A
MMPLIFVKKGKVRVISIRGGRGITHRLSRLGILPGDIIEVTKGYPGPLQIKKGDSRIAIGMGIANKIIVAPVEE